MKHGIIAILIIFLFVGEISALNISSMNGERGKRDFEFSKTIFIKGIEFKSGFLKMPLDGYKTKKYSNIKILSKKFYHRILNCFKGEKCEAGGEKKDVLIKVEKIFPLKSPFRIANANISFDEELIVVFGVVKETEARGNTAEAGRQKQEIRSQRSETATTDSDKFWISYPKAFEITNEVFKDKLEKLIKEEFRKTFSRSKNKRK